MPLQFGVRNKWCMDRNGKLFIRSWEGYFLWKKTQKIIAEWTHNYFIARVHILFHC